MGISDSFCKNNKVSVKWGQLHFTHPSSNPLALESCKRRQDREHDSADAVTSDITTQVDEVGRNSPVRSLFDFVAVVEVFTQRVGLDVVLVQDVKVQRLGPPFHVGRAGRRRPAMHYRALARPVEAFCGYV